MTYKHHVCDEGCSVLGVTKSHERARAAHRTQYATKMRRAGRPRLRSQIPDVSPLPPRGPEYNYAWADETAAFSESRVVPDLMKNLETSLRNTRCALAGHDPLRCCTQHERHVTPHRGDASRAD